MAGEKTFVIVGAGLAGARWRRNYEHAISRATSY